MPTAARKTAFIYSDDFLSYNLGGAHPLQQKRLRMVFDLLDAYGALSPSGGPIDPHLPVAATEAELARVHTPDFLEAVHAASKGDRSRYLRNYGLGPGDTPAFDGMYEAAALYAGGTIQAAQLVTTGGYGAAFNVAGGLHHAHPNRASGFCTFADCALGVRALQDNGCHRVLYVDIDAHHGDGTQACFYDDADVMTISFHESGRFLFPGTGFPDELGNGAARGTSLNVPLYPYTLDDVWHEAFDAVVPAAFARFKPDAVVLQVGADAHWEDPLAHLLLTSRRWMEAVEKLLTLSEGLPLVVTGGGGYNIRTVARLWTMVTARCAGLELPDVVPADYAEKHGVTHLHDRSVPTVEAKTQHEARAYAEAEVARLNELLSA